MSEQNINPKGFVMEQNETQPVMGITDANGNMTITNETAELVKELQQIVMTHTLLNMGQYTGKDWKLLIESMVYLENLHKTKLELLKARPDYDVLPKNIKEGK